MMRLIHVWYQYSAYLDYIPAFTTYTSVSVTDTVTAKNDEFFKQYEDLSKLIDA